MFNNHLQEVKEPREVKGFGESIKTRKAKEAKKAKKAKKETRETREKGMIQTQKRMQRELLILSKYLEKYKLFESDDLYDYCLSYLSTKIKEKSTRSYFVSQIYDYLVFGSSEKEKFKKRGIQALIKRKIGFIIEIVIIIQYLDNQILDGKYGAKDSSTKVNKNLISSNILRRLLFEYIDKEIGKKNNKHKILVKKYVEAILLHVDLGQRLDKEFTNYKFYLNPSNLPFAKSELYNFSTLDCIKEIILQIKKEIREEKHQFVDIYFRRIFLTNVCLFHLSAKLITEILSCSDEKKLEILNFSTSYGLAMQIVNDIIDFIPSKLNKETIGKKSTDAFSDLRNLNITLPLILHLEEGYNRNIEKYLNNPKDISIINKLQDILIRELISSRAISKSQRIGYLIGKKAMTYLSNKNPVSSTLENLAEIATMNKFYDILKKIKKSM